MEGIAALTLPLLFVLFIAAGLVKKVDVFEAFLVGAKKGFVSLWGIVPSVLALVFAVKLLRGSGVIDLAVDCLSPMVGRVGIPAEVLPLGLLKSISGSGSTALLTDIFETHGPDSVVGLMASVICCSSETTFYTTAVYFGSVGVKNTRHTILAALVADAAAVIFSILFVNILF
ncbi:MAG: spore maturation protein [Clostridia bacterium]|nr:spore maturation protein [Clostridia bacterium]